MAAQTGNTTAKTLVIALKIVADARAEIAKREVRK